MSDKDSCCVCNSTDEVSLRFIKAGWHHDRYWPNGTFMDNPLNMAYLRYQMCFGCHQMNSTVIHTVKPFLSCKASE